MLLILLCIHHVLCIERLHNPRIALVSYYDGFDIHEKENEGRRDHNQTVVREMQKVCEANRRAYASMYNYMYVNPQKKASRWSKLLLNGKRFKLVMITKALSHFDYILWLDGDVLFHTTQSIQEWILRMGDKEILVAEDIGGPYKFNSGVILLRSTPKTIKFMSEVVTEVIKLPLSGLQDQQAMQTVAFKKYRDILKIIKPRSALQAFAKLKEVKTHSWLVHFTCCNMKCGGKDIPSRFCDPNVYDFRKSLM